MKEDKSSNKNELFESSHLMMILTYTIFSVILIGESFVMNWLKWPIFMIVAGVLMSWYIHFSQLGNDRHRLWLCSILMMATFFYYGTYTTSTFDLAIVMSVVMLLYTMTGIHSMITLCQVTYYVTFAYEIFAMVMEGYKFDQLIISRCVLHIAVITITSWIARTIIDKWSEVLDRSRDEIALLNESAEKLSDFVANVSHEIRTPINAILGICEISLERDNSDSTRESFVSINEAGKRISEKIEDILDYSEIDRHDLTNNYEDYMLSSVLNDLVTMIAPYRKKEVELIIDVDASIPYILNSDAGKIKKILFHTVVNGLKYTDAGGVYVHISAIPQPYGVNLRIDVKDTGKGMDDELIEKVYNDFYQGDSGRNRENGGLGLGMQIVHGFVSALGGFMTIESKVGEGTNIRITIPNKVIDNSVCMSIKDREETSLGAYLHFEKYENPHVREYYNSMVKNLVTGLKVKLHRVDNENSLHELTENKAFSHLFVGPEEYNGSVEFIEELAKTIIVSVVANPEELNRPADSRVRVLPKPFYCFPIIGVLNSRPGDEIMDEGLLSFPGVKVLVVDDEPMNLIVAARMFERYDMIVETVDSGQKAIDYCHDHDVDIIFMDHMMPQMDGVEAMKRIRSDVGRGMNLVPIIAFTANAVSSAREMFRSEGFDGFIAKPVERVELERVLKRTLSSYVVIRSSEEASKKVMSRSLSGGLHDQENSVPLNTPTGPSADSFASAGINVQTGLNYCQNDRAFYDDLLKQYVKESADKIRIIDLALKTDDLKAYTIQVHSIKSTSKMIGASALSEKARKLEEAAKQYNREYIDVNHDDMMSKYLVVIEAIKNEMGPVDTSGQTDDSDILEFSPS